MADGAMFLPRFITSKELMEELAGMRAIDDFFLLSDLYNIYIGKEEEPVNFETFMNWGTTLLQDLKEIDHQLVDASELFAVLTDIKQLEFWHPGENGLSEFQKKYLEFCYKLLPLYDEFNSSLLQKRIGHSGLIDRRASELVNNKTFHRESTFLVAGFNAFTHAEEKVFDCLKKSYSLQMIFDYDHYYLDDEKHEAGFFARINSKKFSSIKENASKDFESTKEVNVYRCTTSYEQTLLLSQLLSDLNSEHDLLNTAVILPDEAMLIPVLQHLPSNISKVNVTMGYSLQNSPFFESLEHLFRLYINSRKNQQGEIISFYYKDVLSLFQNKQSNSNSDKNEKDNLLTQIVSLNQTYIAIDHFISSSSALGLFKNITWIRKTSARSFLDLIRTFIIDSDTELLKEQGFSNKIKREFLLHHMEVLDQVNEIVKKLEESIDLITLHKIWGHYTKIAKVQFTGEPLAGLQIMGLLESRTLDFERVIVLNVNEGVLPDEKKASSLIPNDLKRKFKMNLNRERDAVIAYHFYRLLQRAKKIQLLYSNQVDSLKGGEKSRYILQLKKELLVASPTSSFKEHHSYVPFRKNNQEELKVKKSPQVLSLIRQKFQRGLSPSSLINYLNCPLNFYYTDLLGLKNKLDVTEILTHDIIGSIVHTTLEELYQHYVGKNISPEDIDEMKKNLPQVLSKTFTLISGSDQINNGKNLLSINMAEKMISRLLDKERKNVGQNQIKLLALESRFQRKLTLNDGTEILLKGIIDRIELRNGMLHLIDYKTGNVEKRDLQVSDTDTAAFENKEKVFQLITYALLVSDTPEYNSYDIKASVYSLKSYDDLFIPLQINKEEHIERKDIKDQEQRILEIASLMLDINSPFLHHNTGLYCNYCQ